MMFKMGIQVLFAGDNINEKKCCAYFKRFLFRKCTNLIETFHNFQLTVSEGQKTLVKQVEACRARKASSSTSVELSEDILVDEPESIGVDPLESNEVGGDFNSILPDTELDTDTFTIKEEKIGGLASSKHSAVATTSKSVVTTSAISNIAPMTAVFTEAVSEISAIKVEPGIKREAGDVGDSSQDLSREFKSVKCKGTQETADADCDNKDVGDKKDTSIDSKDYNLSSNQTSEVNKGINADSDGTTETEPEKESFNKPGQEKETFDIPEPESSDKSEPEKESSDKTEPEEESSDKSEPEEESSDKSEPEKESSDHLEQEKESCDKSEPGKESSDKTEPEKESSDNLQLMEGNEDFGGLFSDYPAWHQDAVTGEDNTEDGMPGLEEIDHPDNDPGMMEEGSKDGDELNPLYDMDEIGDPLFEIEEGDFCLVEDENGIDRDPEDPTNETEQNSCHGPPDGGNDGIPENYEDEVMGHNNSTDIHLGDVNSEVDPNTSTIESEETKDSDNDIMKLHGDLSSPENDLN